MSSWGFAYRTCAVWDKQVDELGQFLSGQHELLLIGVKGKYAIPQTDVRVSSVYSEKCDFNSKKPDYYYKMIEEMCPVDRYLELFASKPYSERWTVWGNQAVESGEGNE
jgi:N6-adenosine-specific RNA methylase IME4